mmetsp:Transcript_42319/g.133326  ORF Transcript_42319/g.133326 Transcript_42319/m.133326 type:complete len:253 (-) Transcript_42319:110-868(-)
MCKAHSIPTPRKRTGGGGGSGATAAARLSRATARAGGPVRLSRAQRSAAEREGASIKSNHLVHHRTRDILEERQGQEEATNQHRRELDHADDLSTRRSPTSGGRGRGRRGRRKFCQPDDMQQGWKVLKRIIEAIAEDPYKQPVPLLDRFKDQHSYVGNSSEVTPMQAFLRAIPGVGEKPAAAIASEHASLRSLAQIYEDPTMSLERKRNLLRDMPFRCSSTSAREERRVGIRTSEKIFQIFTCTEGSAIFDG